MFVVYYKKKGSTIRYFNYDKGLQKTIKTATVLCDTFREKFEEAARQSGIVHIKPIEVSPMAELMYQGKTVQYNQIQW